MSQNILLGLSILTMGAGVFTIAVLLPVPLISGIATLAIFIGILLMLRGSGSNVALKRFLIASVVFLVVGFLLSLVAALYLLGVNPENFRSTLWTIVAMGLIAGFTTAIAIFLAPYSLCDRKGKALLSVGLIIILVSGIGSAFFAEGIVDKCAKTMALLDPSGDNEELLSDLEEDLNLISSGSILLRVTSFVGHFLIFLVAYRRLKIFYSVLPSNLEQ